MARRRLVAGLAVLAAVAATATAGDRAGPSALCHDAARIAADRHGVPARVMRAITLVETGRGGRPWPWTLNVAGKGFWFDDRAAALAFARRTLAGGERSFDLGCFQLNYRWHGMHFEGLAPMLDPRASADYAARFLKALKAETGHWLDAAGRYHSRTPRHFRRYRALVEAALARLEDAPAPVMPVARRKSPPASRPASPSAPPLSPGAVPLAALPAAQSLLRPSTGSLLR